MKKRLAELTYRRSRLLEKIEIQRMDVADISLDLQKPLALADAGLKAVRFIRNHPGLVSGGFAALLSLRGKGVAGLAQKGWRLMYLYPSILSFGLKYLFSAFRSPSAEELLMKTLAIRLGEQATLAKSLFMAGHPEERNSEVDHSQ
jgi:hypothetical protein